MFKNVLQSKLMSVGLVLIIGFFLLSIIKLQPALVSVRKEIKNVDQKINEIEKVRKETEKLGEYLNSPAYLERQARIRLNYKKPGESVVYIYTNEKQNKVSEKQEEKWSGKILKTKFAKNFQLWWRYLVE